ncbi:hypothetical protein AMS68_004727 [Peltaster fructicola]|uniref:ubiquitinyl hydrolase 1 n=1 Tax=Peltaster fructicola TaxID=286661 RepID=A0A6H0XXR3_9PEZI|nr:hypothetical protein AMS68_004727 [Peltaster fructicola]
MAYTPQMNEDEFAEMQKLSEGWEAEVKGQLVSTRQPSTAITEEYATADPIYQQKTAALPKTFSHYRTVRGDGRCGWRAIGFAFLEKLILNNDATKLIEQEARLRSLSNVINSAGYAPMVYEDFADVLFDFMRALGDAVRAGNAESALLEGFNKDDIESAVITHLRTLTAAWMKTHPEEYVNYTPDLSIDRYVDESVLPYRAEIDHVGLSALNDVLLAPAGIGLEVLYLDLTPGPEVNLHNFTRSDQLGYTDTCVRLLYRPGHYDILYKIEDIPAPPVSTYLQISSHTYNEPVFDLPVADFMTMVPGMSMTNRQHGWISSNSYGGVCDFFPAPTPAQPCATAISTPASSASASTMIPQHSSYASHQTVLSLPPNHLPAQELTIRPATHSMLQAGLPQIGASGGPFRPSHWELEPDIARATSQMPLQTSIFRNSHFNTAHFLNPDFQPEEWSPEAEYVTTSVKAKHKLSN